MNYPRVEVPAASRVHPGVLRLAFDSVPDLGLGNLDDRIYILSRNSYVDSLLSVF